MKKAPFLRRGQSTPQWISGGILPSTKANTCLAGFLGTQLAQGKGRLWESQGREVFSL